jgi:methionine-rich copper-binding protein CopC
MWKRVILALLAAATTVSPAFAHTKLVTANPAPNSVVRQAPSRIAITFNEPVLQRFTTLSVSGPGGKLHVMPIEVDPKNKARISAVIHGGGKPGVYRVDWSAAGSDMHKMTGGYSFTVKP